MKNKAIKEIIEIITENIIPSLALPFKVIKISSINQLKYSIKKIDDILANKSTFNK